MGLSSKPFILGLGLLFWGIMTGRYVEGAVLALLLEIRHLIPRRLDLDDTDFTRASDLCILLGLGLLVYLFLTPFNRRLLFILAEWAPIVFFPLAAAQCWARQRTARLFAVIYFLRINRLRNALRRLFRVPPASLGRASETRLDLAGPYFFLCLIAAGCGQAPGLSYYAGIGSLTLLAVFQVRPRRHSPALFLMVAAIGLALGYATFTGVAAAQNALRGWASRFHQDPYLTTADVGHLTKDKLSHDIVFRVRIQGTPTGLRLLMREAAYDFFNGSAWLATDADFMEVLPSDDDPGRWELQEDLPTSEVETDILTVFQYFPSAEQILVLPQGAMRIERLEAEDMVRNRLATIKTGRAPGLCAYRVAFDPRTSLMGPPADIDLFVPPDLLEPARNLARESGLDGMEDLEMPMALAAHFRDHFTYSLAPPDDQSVLVRDFMTTTRRGHCEFFASAAVLALRAAGIPARYVVGYAVEEYDEDGGMYLVRSLHAHAWASAWIRGHWVEVDATPPSWIREDSANPPYWQFLSDFRARAMFWIATMRWLEEGRSSRYLLLAATIPLWLFLIWRLRRKRRPTSQVDGRQEGRTGDGPGMDSPLFAVESLLARKGCIRPAHVPLGRWLREELSGTSGNVLASAAALHDRYRFDPASLHAGDRRRLERLSRDLLQKLERRT